MRIWRVMIKHNVMVRYRYYLPPASAVLTVIFLLVVAATGKCAQREFQPSAAAKKVPVTKLSHVMDAEHEKLIRFASYHGVADPVALASAVSYSPLANLLISVAIEESRGDPVAIGSAGEQGAWQVKASDWGIVPKDIYGQAGQAERIIRGLMIDSNGNKIKALARYNGGSTPPVKSYRYAERILKRARYLQVAAHMFEPNYRELRQAMLDLPGKSRILSSFFHAGRTSGSASFVA